MQVRFVRVKVLFYSICVFVPMPFSDMKVPLATPITPGNSFPVQVRDAGKKGRGVFATRIIRKGEVCCWYDGIVTDGIATAHWTTGMTGYAQRLLEDRDWFIAGFRSQFRPGGCAQLCNDASTDYSTHDVGYLKQINVKEAMSAEGAFAFVATKRIKQGEELLYSYGPGYWEFRKLAAGLSAQAAFVSFSASLREKAEDKERFDKLVSEYDSSGGDYADYVKRYHVLMQVRKYDKDGLGMK